MSIPIQNFQPPFDVAALQKAGISRYGFLSPDQLVFGEEIRHICESNACRSYNTTWACPPAVGTLKACRQQCLSFAHAMAFCSCYPLDDSFDYEGMQRGHHCFKQACDALAELVRAEIPHFLLLSNEGCTRCKNCTWPDAPCRFPQQLYPSLEGYGLYVNKLADTAGLPYHGGPNTVTYFGLLLF